MVKSKELFNDVAARGAPGPEGRRHWHDSRWHRHSLEVYALAISALCTVGCVAAAASNSEGGSADPESNTSDASLVRLYNTGFHLSLIPAVFFPTSSAQKVGFALSLQGRYGIDVGSIIVSPGAKAAAYFGDSNAYIGMPTIRLTAPLGVFGPYIEAGLGVGNQSSTTGVALLGGAGFMLYFGSRFGLGLSAEYEKITGTDFSVLTIGPGLMISF